VSTRGKKIVVAILCWLIGSLVGAGVLALFVDPGNESYWPSAASTAGILLIMIVAFWVRDKRPKRKQGYSVLALALGIPALILVVAFGLGPALSTLAGGFTGVLIITWPYLTGKKAASQPGT
jgi:membrane protein YdbS with pleckstrin-like domain